MTEKKTRWEDLCDTESESETKTEKSAKSTAKPEIHEIHETQEIPPNSTQFKEIPAEKKTLPFNNQPKDEMLEEIEKTENGHIFINIFNIESSATIDDILNFYQNIRIKTIYVNEYKKGNYDLEFDSKEEAIKFITKGTGRINKRAFFMRISYKNKPKPLNGGNNERKEEKVRKNPKKPIKRAEEDDDVDYYFYSQNANFKDKTPKLPKMKINRTYSNKIFDKNASLKGPKEKTQQIKKVTSGPKKLFSVEYVVKDSSFHPPIQEKFQAEQEKSHENSNGNMNKSNNNDNNILLCSTEPHDFDTDHRHSDAHYYSFVNTSQEIDAELKDLKDKDHILGDKQILSDLSKNEIFGTPKNDLSYISKHTEELGNSANKHFSIDEHIGGEKYGEILKNAINEGNGESDHSKSKDEKMLKNDEIDGDDEEKEEEEEEKEEEKKKKKNNKKKKRNANNKKHEGGTQQKPPVKATNNIYDILAKKMK